MTSFNWKKSAEDVIRDELFIITGVTRMFFALKTVIAKLPFIDIMYIMKLAGGICGGVLLKDYAVYRKWINE